MKAQDGDFIWAKTFGGNSKDEGTVITTDDSVYVYVSGHFGSTVDFDPGPAIFNLTSKGVLDMFIEKLDAKGDLIWAKSLGGESGSVSGFSITTDIFGNVYMTGAFQGTVDFDPGPAIFNLTSTGTIDVFILKLDANGNLIWVKAVGGAGSDRGSSIIVDKLQNIYVSGFFTEKADFNPGPGVFNLTTKDSLTSFLLKMNASGRFVWARTLLSSATFAWQNEITADNIGNVFVTVSYADSAVIDAGPSKIRLKSNGLYDILIQKIDSQGRTIWAKSIGGKGEDYYVSMTSDSMGNIYVTGEFNSYGELTDFDPGPSVYPIDGFRASFFLKLSNNGDFIWVKSLSTGRNDGYMMVKDITTDVSGNVYATGYFVSTLDFDPGPGVFNLTADFAGAFVLKLNNAGDFNWARMIETYRNEDHFLNIGNSITVDKFGSAYITGYFQGMADFDPGPSILNLTSNNNTFDIFVQKLGSAPTNENRRFIADVFPNPTDRIINIRFHYLTKVSVKLFTINGQLLYEIDNINVPVYQLELDVASGVYLLLINYQDRQEHFKIIKK